MSIAPPAHTDHIVRGHVIAVGQTVSVTRVSNTATVRWDVLALVIVKTPATRTLRFDVAARQTATVGLAWDTLTRVAATRAIRADITAASYKVSAVRALRFDLASRQTATRGLAWDIIGKQSATRGLIWDTATRVAATRALVYEILSSVTRQSATRALQWDTASRVTDDLTVRWDVLTRVSDPTQLIWDTRVSASATRGLVWDVTAPNAAVRSVGTVSATANNVATPFGLTPGLPATRVANDMLLLLTTCPSATPTVATPAGWTQILNVTGTTGRIALYARIVDGSETAPTVTWSGLTTGTTGTPCQAQIACLSGLLASASTLTQLTGTVSNQVASTTAAAGGAAITNNLNNGVVLSLSVRADDVGTWGTLATAEGITWAKVATTAVSTSGNDTAQEWQFGQQATAAAIAAKTFTLTGGVSFASSGVMVVLKPR